MVVKDTYDYDQKAQARDELREFISRHYNSYSARKKLKVLTFLGHEDHELTQIWDPLGIPRSNITVLEKNKKVYDIVKNKNLGIHLINGTIEDFVLETDDTFDIANIDYQTYFNIGVKETLKTMAYNHILNDKGILATWLSGKRENAVATTVYMSNLCTRFDKDFCDISKEDAFDDRSNVISSEIVTAFLDGRTNYEPHALIDRLGILDEYADYMKKTEGFKDFGNTMFRLLYSKDPYNDLVMGIMKKYRYNQLEAYKRMRKSAVERKSISRQDALEFVEHMHRSEGMVFVYDTLSKLVSDSIELNADAVARRLRKIGGSRADEFAGELQENFKEYMRMLSGILYYQDIGSYLSIDTKRFKYIGDNGTPMYVDFNLFSQENLKNIARINIINDGSGTGADKKLYINGIEGLDKKAGKIQDFARSFNKCNNPEEFCGKRIDIVPRPKVRGLIADSTTNTDIAELVTEYPETLSVSKEFNTVTSTSDTSIGSGSSNYDSLSAVNALIAQGKSAREINKLYPDYPVMKIAGMKAAYRRKENKGIVFSDVEADNSTNSASLEKNSDLSKQDAIFLIQSGFTTEEIANTFNSFDKNQLKAFKAHNTMGKYDSQKDI